ncbi:hypothetical protein GCM10009828_012870 [Actinoplanes couchii]|uniref:Uncharacterized protein n=1 Tax=Actinoplanes couchii TaxID=403638 RepID=A0ABQ3XJC0_9ACTN|nr:hypothetical protein Aco03nite_069980 [Actinoplanes couchii]
MPQRLRGLHEPFDKLAVMPGGLPERSGRPVYHDDDVQVGPSGTAGGRRAAPEKGGVRLRKPNSDKPGSDVHRIH